MSIEIDLKGRVALVTGASQGLGEAMARRLHAAGARVILNHPDLGNGATRRDTETICAELNGVRPDSAHPAAANVADAEAVRRMMESVRTRWGGLDILINNAGILRDKSIRKMEVAEWNAVIAVNLSGVFHGCKFGLEIMRDGGAVVNISSLSALIGFFGQSNYAAAKAGVIGLTRVLSREVARRGIRVNAIAPGVIGTAMAHGLPDEVLQSFLKQIPLERFGKPSEIADVALFLCSPLASYVTGQTLEVNGGWHS